MIGYLLRRLGVSVLMIVLVSILIFVVLRLLPGDPTITRFGQQEGIDPKTIAAMRAQLGLNDPIIVQYWHWVTGIVVHGDFGKSYFSQFAVGTLIAQRLGPTLELSVAGLVLAVVFAVVLAVLPTVLRGRWWSRLVGTYTTIGLSAPPFVFGIIFVALFSVKLGWLPDRGYVSPSADLGGNLRLLILPALTLGLALSAPLIRYLRASLADVETSSFVRTATGKGITRASVVFGHVLPNGLLPALTSLGVSVGAVLGGAVVVEYVFAWPGLGSLIVDSVFKRDYAVLQSTVLMLATVFVVVNLLVDILYGVLDPRLRVGGDRR